MANLIIPGEFKIYTPCGLRGLSGGDGMILWRPILQLARPTGPSRAFWT